MAKAHVGGGRWGCGVQLERAGSDRVGAGRARSQSKRSRTAEFIDVLLVLCVPRR